MSPEGILSPLKFLLDLSYKWNVFKKSRVQTNKSEITFVLDSRLLPFDGP